MNLMISKSTGEQLVLHAMLPPAAATRLAGAMIWSHNDNDEMILVEEFNRGPFTIRFIFFQFVKQATLFLQEQVPFLRARFITKDSWSLRHPNLSYRIREGQSLMYLSRDIIEQLELKAGVAYECIDAQCAIEKLRLYTPLFPELANMLDGIPSSSKNKIQWITPIIADVLRSIEHCVFTDSLREYYIEHKLEELFLLILEQQFKKKTSKEDPTAKDIEAIHNVEQLIMQDISRHYSIPELSKRFGINEFQLKQLFRKIYGEGIFEHLLHARMKEAHLLLENTDKPIKEIAGLIGYKFLSSFVTAFRKYFQNAPGELRRNRE